MISLALGVLLIWAVAIICAILFFIISIAPYLAVVSMIVIPIILYVYIEEKAYKFEHRKDYSPLDYDIFYHLKYYNKPLNMEEILDYYGFENTDPFIVYNRIEELVEQNRIIRTNVDNVAYFEVNKDALDKKLCHACGNFEDKNSDYCSKCGHRL